MKKLLCLLLVSFSVSLFAQNEQMRHQMQNPIPVKNTRDVPSENIQFWVGQGHSEVVAVFFFCGNGTPGGVAYGYRFDGVATIQNLLDDIAAADQNFTITYSGGFINDCGYNNGTLNYLISGGMMMYTVNGDWASGISDPLSDGAYFELSEWGDCTLPTDNIYYPEDPNAQEVPADAGISTEDILYWVGNGTHSAILAVNWCAPEMAFAWGVHFDGDSALVADLMHTIAIYDGRFSYAANGSMMSDITFQNGTYDLSLQGSWWMYNINGMSAMNGFMDQYVYDGDLVKWGDESCGISDEFYNYIWTAEILPVSLPSPEATAFDGVVGTEGCQAIHCENEAILGWASECTIERGYQDIASPTLLASFGSESAGVGPATAVSTDAVSLGDGGIAVLTFNQPIANGTGYDFAVFENSLNNIFLELAFVEVSSDGTHFYRFPSVSNTPIDEQIDNAGSVDATLLHNLAGKYCAGWGTPFDLEELDGYSNLDINNVTHVRIVDAVGSVNPQYATIDKNGHIVNDPYPTNFASGGFDLTGVAILNGWTPSQVNEMAYQNAVYAWPNPCMEQCTLRSAQKEIHKVEVFDVNGKMIYSANNVLQSYLLNTSDWKSGVYAFRIYFADGSVSYQKVVKM